MKKIDIKDLLGADLTEHEKIFWEMSLGGLTKDRKTKRPDLERAILLWWLTHRSALSTALDIGTASWLSALAMAHGGALTTTLDISPKGTGNWGALKEARKLVTSVVEPSQKFLERNTHLSWDIIFIDGDHSYEGCKKDLELCKDKYNDFLVIHDYGNIGSVTKAVDEVLGPPPILVIDDRKWYDAPYENVEQNYGVALYGYET